MTVTSVGHHVHSTTKAPYRLSIEVAGFMTFLLGAWGGIVPFVAPLFGFSADGTGSWTWSLSHALLFLIPGAAGCLAGLVIMIEGLTGGPARRMMLAFGGLLAAVCGAWLIVGPLTWPVLEGRAFYVGAAPLRELAYWIGYSLGPGALLLAFGAFILGRPHENWPLIEEE